MKKIIIAMFAMLAIPSTSSAYDWRSAFGEGGGAPECVTSMVEHRQLPEWCSDNQIYQLSVTYTNIVAVDGVPSVVIKGKSVRFMEQSYPVDDVTIPVQKGSIGDQAIVAAGGRFLVIEHDDPLYNPYGGLAGKVVFIVEAFKDASGSNLTNIFTGTPEYEKEIPNAIALFKAGKTKRIEAAIDKESEVKIFGMNLYGLDKDSLSKKMRAKAANRIGSINGFSSDVFDTSSIVSGTDSMTALYNNRGIIGKLQYKFNNNSLSDVLTRLSSVYGKPLSRVSDNSGYTWKRGRITINTNTDQNGRNVFITYIIMPFGDNIAVDNSNNISAF